MSDFKADEALTPEGTDETVFMTPPLQTDDAQPEAEGAVSQDAPSSADVTFRRVERRSLDMTLPLVEEDANTVAPDGCKLPNMGYATVYPLTMFLRIFTAQLLVLMAV